MSFTGGIILPKQAASGNPPAGKRGFGFDGNGNPYLIDEAGNIFNLSTPAPEQADLTPAAAVTAYLFAVTGFLTLAIRIEATAGSGAFTAAYGLPLAGMLDGAIAEVNIDFPASANPTVTIATGAGGVTVIASATNPAPAAVANWYGRFRYNATANAWRCLTRAFNS